MKKIHQFTIIAAAIFALAACSNEPKGSLESPVEIPPSSVDLIEISAKISPPGGFSSAAHLSSSIYNGSTWNLVFIDVVLINKETEFRTFRISKEERISAKSRETRKAVLVSPKSEGTGWTSIGNFLGSNVGSEDWKFYLENAYGFIE